MMTALFRERHAAALRAHYERALADITDAEVCAWAAVHVPDGEPARTFIDRGGATRMDGGSEP